MRNGEVVGEIRPGASTEAPPLFKVIPKRMRKWEAEDKCQHGAFVLDEEWAEVSCGHCGQMLDPFSVLARYAQWWKEFDNRRLSAEEAEKRMHVTELRRLRRLRATTDEERSEIDKLLARYPRLGEARDLAVRIGREIQSRKIGRRR